jgi:hypothetical protein
MLPLRISQVKVEGVLNVSKWIKHQVLLGREEMQSLFDHLGPISLYNISEVVAADDCALRNEVFLQQYGEYAHTLKEGKVPDEKNLRRYFSSVVSITPDVLYAMEVKPGAYLVKPIRPVIQLQLHQFLPSETDGKYHPMVLGNDSVTWGLQFSYPQIFQHPQTKQFSKVADDADFPNTSVFLRMAKWFRNHTVPTTFVWKEKSTSVPIRTGKEALSWVNFHPQLQAKGICVHVY